VLSGAGQMTAREVVDGIFAAVQEFRGDTTPNDDMTAVALRITA
jgi:serine phosphatase RsbU (regulator of sigma subunit)